MDFNESKSQSSSYLMDIMNDKFGKKSKSSEQEEFLDKSTNQSKDQTDQVQQSVNLEIIADELQPDYLD